MPAVEYWSPAHRPEASCSRPFNSDGKEKGLAWFTSRVGHLVQWQDVLEVLQDIRRARLQASTVSFNAVACGLSRAKQWQLAQEVLFALRAHGLQPRAASLGAALGSCQAAGGLWRQAIRLLHAARRAWCLQKLSAAICSAVAAHGPSSWQAAEALIGQLVQSGRILNIAHFNAQLDTLSGGLWATALDKVDKSISKPDAVTFNTMIHATTADVWQLSFSFLQNMRCARLACTVKSYGALAAGLESTCSWVLAVLLLRGMHRNTVEMNAIVKGSAAGALAEDGAWHHASALCADAAQLHRRMVTAAGHSWEGSLQWLDLLERRRVRQDFSMWAATTTSASRWNMSLSISLVCGRRGMSSNIVAIGTLARPLQDAQRWQEAGHLLQTSKQHHLQANLVTFGMLTSACSSSQCWPASMQVLDAACSAAVLPDTDIHNVAARGAAKQGHWEISCELIRAVRLRRLQADWQTPVSACSGVAMQHRWRHCLQMVAEITPKHLASAAGVFALGLCAEAARWQLVLAWLRASTQPPQEAYAAALAALASTGKVLEAHGLLASLRAQMLRMESSHLTNALGVARQGQPWVSSLQLLKLGQLAGLHLHQAVWHAGVDACGSWRHALLLLASAQSCHVEPDVTSVAAATNRASLRSVQATLRLLHELQQMHLCQLHADSGRVCMYNLTEWCKTRSPDCGRQQRGLCRGRQNGNSQLADVESSLSDILLLWSILQYRLLFGAAAMASLSSLAGLSHRLEESRARQLQERSSQALQLMRTAVEWKSWEELRTLTKAFQRYLEEIRETDLRRRRDIEANLSRVCAARDQLANVTAHKTEATEEVARLSADNVELRRQLEFDARQFVALLQSCAHLEKQLGVLRKGKERDPGKEPIAETGESEELGLQTDVKSEKEVPLGATLPDPVASDSSSKSRPLCRRAASAAGGEAASEREVPAMPPSLRSGKCGTAQPASGLDASPTASLQTSDDASPATVVAPGDALPAASPCSRSQTSEPTSQTKNQRLLQDLPLDALGMLQSLVAVKQHLLQLQTAQGEPALSTSDGTPARKDPTSPEHGQDDDSTSTAMDSGASRSSGGGHAHSGCEGVGQPRAMQREEQNLAKGTLPQELPGSPRPSSRPCDVASPLRPSALAAAEAARWAQVKHAQPAAPLMREPVASEPRTATESIVSQPVASSKSLLSTPTKNILTSSLSPAALPGRQPPDSTMMSPTSQVTPGHQCRGHGRAAGSPARSPVRSQVWAGQSPDSAERLRASFKQLPAVPPLPCQSPRSPRGSPAHASPAPKYGSNRTTLQTSSPRPRDSTRGARADASYVATVQLVRELNNGNVPAATASSGPPKPYKGLPQKEVQKLIVERAKRREAPMSRNEGEVPARTNSKRRERAERGGRGAASSASNTKASL
eukprot:s723_g7.t2